MIRNRLNTLIDSICLRIITDLQSLTEWFIESSIDLSGQANSIRESLS
jgi:hypothetical protein